MQTHEYEPSNKTLTYNQSKGLTDNIVFSTIREFKKDRLVRYALLQTACSAPGVLNSEKSLDETKHPGLKVYAEPEGLLCCVKGQELVIPYANVAIYWIDKRN